VYDVLHVEERARAEQGVEAIAGMV
jgi:hypothetical protein